MNKQELNVLPEINVSDWLKSIPTMPMNPAMMAPPWRQFWQMQENILAESQTYSRHWFERRHEANVSALSILDRALSTDAAHPVALLTSLSDWQSHSVERLMEDVQEYLNLCARCSEHLLHPELQSSYEPRENTQ